MFAPRGRTELRRLLDVAELDALVPSTLWDRVDEHTWRTGTAGADQPAWQGAAHAAGSVSAARRFSSEEGDGLTVQVVPLATAADAAEALTHATDPALPFRVTDPPAAPGDADPPLVLAGSAGAHVVVVLGSGAGWTHHDLAAVLAAQLARLS